MTCIVDPSPLQPSLRTEEFETLFHLLKEATTCQEMVRLLVYHIDTVDISVLNHLAEQFDVLGYKGWLFADTEIKQRDLLSRSVRLHRTAATPSSIIEVLAILGIEVSDIEENPALTYDGSWQYNGAEFYGGKKWDRFIVNFENPVSPENEDLVYAVVTEWKNARSHQLRPVILLQYDGSWQYDGTQTYDGSKNET
jgi:hypothetical protein